MRFENLVAECCGGPVYDRAAYAEIGSLGAARRALSAAVSLAAYIGRPLVVELPDHRLAAVQSLDPDECDHPIPDPLDSRAPYRALLARCLAGPLKPFAQRDAPSVR